MVTSQASNTERRLLILILTLFVTAASLYSIVTPPFEMSDELWHYPMVKRLADGEGLVVQDPANVGPWRQEGSQPPLYYALGALATFWIDTDDMAEVRRENPHVDNGLITADGNTNLIVHAIERERWPWRGTILAVHIVRFLSVLLSAGTVYFTYRTGIEVFPRQRWLGLAAAAFVGFIPMFTFISGAVNNDNLAVLLYTASVWWMIRTIRDNEAGAGTLKHAVVLGVLLGLGAITKVSNLGLFGLAGVTMAAAALRRKRWQTFFVEGPLIIAIAAAIAGWWYLRNLRLYGDLLGLNAFIAVLGQRARPASLAQLWTERQGFMMSYWGLFGGVNVPMAMWIYHVLNTLFVVGLLGALPVLILRWRREQPAVPEWMPVVLTLLAIVAVIAPLAGSWSRATWSSQGRLVFYAIASITVWMMAGLAAWMPEQAGKLLAAVLAVGMAALTFAAPFVWIRPAYAPPVQAEAPDTPPAAAFTPQGADAPALRLLEYTLETDRVEPGGVVWLNLTWEAATPMDRLWSVFIHLQDSAGLLAGQRDTYPGVGLLATTDIMPGQRWTDRYAVRVMESAYAPETIDVLVGVYDYATCPACERMQIGDGSDALRIGSVTLEPRAHSEGIPNPITINFGGEMELSGYTLDRREGMPGESLTLTLFWRGLSAMERNYTISAQVIAEDTTRYAQQDAWPLDGARPTSTWSVGEMIEDTASLTLSEDTPPGVYWVQVVVYWQGGDGAFNRLQRITADGRLTDDFYLLTQIRVR